MMRSLFGAIGNVSPVKQDYVWVGEYYDGTHLSEFDLVTGTENNFHALEQNDVVRFGLVGRGMKVFFEDTGVFNVKGKAYYLSYTVDGETYQITDKVMKRTIITFKDAEAIFNPFDGGKPTNGITQFNVGYETEVVIKEVIVKLKVFVKIPVSGEMYFHIAMIPDADLNGNLVLHRANDRNEFEIDAPLKCNVIGEIHHLIK